MVTCFEIMLISLIFADPNTLLLDEPSTYCHGYLQMICDGWMQRPSVELYRGPPNVHVSGKLHLAISDGTPETIIKTVQLGVMDLDAFARYAKKHPGGLKSKPQPPPSAPPVMSRLEAIAMFMELFMETK